MAVVRDTQWLMLEACREFQRGTCKRTDTECKYAHPSKSVTVENGRVTACFDSLKGRCTRENCKYLHPPPHLKTQLEINGRNNLAAQKMLQNIQSQQLMHTAAAAAAMQQSLPGVLPSQSLPSMAQPVPSVSQANHQASQDAVYLYPSMQLPLTPSPVPNSLPGYPYLTQAPGGTTNPNIMQEMNLQGQMLPTPGTALPIIPTAKNKNDKLEANPYTAWVHQQFMKSAGHQDYSGLSTQPAVMQGHTHQLNSQLQVCREFQRGNCSRGEQECKFAHPNEQTTIDNTDNTVTVCMDYIKGRCTREKCKYFHPPPHLQAKIKAAQHQANQASVVPAVLPTTTPENSLKRQRDPADDILLQFPGFVPPTKKHPSMAGSQHNTILNHHHHHPSVGINHYLQMQLSNAGQPPSYIPAPGINQYLQQLSNAVGQPPSYIPAPGINQYLQQLSNAAGQPSPYAPGVERTILGGLPASYAWQQGKLGNSFLCQGDIMSHPALAIPMMQPMAGTPASVPLYTHQYVQSQQSADTIPVCRDFKSGSCKRPNCKYAHVTEDYVEIIDGKVTLCRYAAQSRCTRPKCKFYHPPAASLPLMTTVPIGSIPTTPVVTSV